MFDIPISAWVGTGILTVVTLTLFARLGFSAKKERARSWVALTLLYVMWSIHLAVLGRETAITTMLMSLLFAAISFHRYRVDDPGGRADRLSQRHRWLPQFNDRT